MAESPNTPRALSEIGHLFLSSVRERQMEGKQLPRRYPPGARATAPVIEPPRADEAPEARLPQVTAVLASHLNESQSEHVHQYANHLAARGLRIGLIEVESATVRVTTFEGPGDQEPSATTENFDARTVTEVLSELSWDLDRWLLVLPGNRNWEAKCLLRDVSHWVLLSKCDHEGVINCYRMLKGLNPGGEDWPRPRLSLALLQTQDAEEAEHVHRKLAGVCEQFLAMPLESEPTVGPVNRAVLEHHMTYEIAPAENGRERQMGIGPQWQVMADFLAKTKSTPPATAPQETAPPAKNVQEAKEPMQNKTHAPMSQQAPMMTEQRPAASAAPMRLTSKAMDEVSDVIELPDAATTTEAIIAAVMNSEMSSLMECPIPVPRCPEAKLVVTRDRQMMLLAVKGSDMTDLRPIAQAYQWMCENRRLIAMALPQLAIDPNAEPMLRLMVDRLDADSQAMHSMFYGATVTVQIYRRLRWQGRTGLLVEAA
jgi:hypothetical protein